MRILFLHGWTSVPGGVKPTYLADAGHSVLNPALDDDDFALAVRVAEQQLADHDVDLIVGSSRGGAVAMNVGHSSIPRVLLCPAWKNWGTAASVTPATRILHSRHDDVIPFEHSVELIAGSNLSNGSLIETGRDHRLADPESLAAMLSACEQLGP